MMAARVRLVTVNIVLATVQAVIFGTEVNVLPARRQQMKQIVCTEQNIALMDVAEADFAAKTLTFARALSVVKMNIVTVVMDNAFATLRSNILVMKINVFLLSGHHAAENTKLALALVQFIAQAQEKRLNLSIILIITINGKIILAKLIIQVRERFLSSVLLSNDIIKK